MIRMHGQAAMAYILIAFIHEVKEFWDGPAVLRSLSRGEDILAAEILGADFALSRYKIYPCQGKHGERGI